MSHDASQLSIAVVGLSFGAEFAPIYRAHPNVTSTLACDADEGLLDRFCERFNFTRRAGSLEEVLDSDVDAVHLVTPLHQHAEQAIAVMEAGKHVACTVPMALTEDDLQRVIDTSERTGKRYMMMETAVYTREFLYVRDLHTAGALGQVSYAHGAHFQDMTGWPAYWRGLPPMYYMTHAVAPILHLLDTRAATVSCVGSGQTPGGPDPYGNRFTVESAVFTLEGVDAVADVVRSLYNLARPYTEAFSIYGDQLAFEWPQQEETGPALLHHLGVQEEGRGRAVSTEEVRAPDRGDLLPLAIADFSQHGVYDDGSHLSFLQGSGHGGSHPHLVHEFVSALVEQRPPAIDARRAANWTAAGIAAHASALAGGEQVKVPAF